MLPRAWHFLTDPHPSITNIEERRESKLLAGLIVALFSTSLIASGLLILESGSVPGTVLGLWLSLAFTLVLYFMNRGGHYRLSAFLFVGFNLVVTYVMPVLTHELAWLFFTNMVLLLGALLIPRFTVALFFTGLLLHILLAGIFPTTTMMSNLSAIIVYVIVGTLVLVFMQHRISLERERQRELEANNESLRQSEAQLESRVEGRTSELNLANAKMSRHLEQITRLRAELHEEVIRDPLTGLFNRRYLEETLIREIARAHRERYDICFMLLDIDHFKKFNDLYGHATGDLVLRTLSNLLIAHIRTADIPCRMGGEEFLLVLPGMLDEKARSRAEFFRDQIEAVRIPHGDQELALTVSIGVSAFPRNGDTWDQLFQAMDKALYRAKESGRNRVEVA